MTQAEVVVASAMAAKQGERSCMAGDAVGIGLGDAVGLAVGDTVGVIGIAVNSFNLRCIILNNDLLLESHLNFILFVQFDISNHEI